MESISGKWELNDLAIVSFNGPDAANFLHGQISNSVKDLPPDQARPFAYCTAQGRLLANGFYWQIADDSYALLIASDLLETFLKRIKMFVLKSRVKIEHRTDLSVAGIIGTENMPANLHELPAWACSHDGSSYWVKAPAINNINAAWYISDKKIGYGNDKTAWYATRMASGWPLIRLSSQEKFLPSTLNMDLNGSIDFKKGCYPGQEIIARSHYRGTVKRRLAYATAKVPSGFETSELNDLYDQSNHKAIARVIESVVYANKLYLCAEVNLSDVDNNVTYLAGLDGPILKLDLVQSEMAY